MFLYILRRLGYAIPIAIGVSLVCFALMHMAPGSALSSVLPDGASPETVEVIKRAYGFDKPLPVQYLKWLQNVLSGDLGTSISSRRPVLLEVGSALANTLALAMIACLLSFVLGTALGTFSGFFANRPADRAITALSLSGVSIPHYWLGMVLIILFAVNNNYLPATGIGPNGAFGADWESLRHLVLPSITSAVIPTAIIARSVRGAVVDVRKQEFMQTLDAYGLPSGRVILHVMKNVAPLVLAVMGLQLSQLLGGSVLVETVFSWPGTGFLLYNAIFTRDLPVIQGAVLVLAMFFVMTNLFVDLLQSTLDPRIKRF